MRPRATMMRLSAPAQRLLQLSATLSIILCHSLVLIQSASAAQLEGIIYESGFALPSTKVRTGEASALTDTEGCFVLEYLPQGKHTIEIEHPRTKQVVQLEVTVSGESTAPLAFDFASPPSLDEIVIATRRELPKPSKQTIMGSDIQRVAGTGRDVLRALQVLPGITTVNDLSGELFIRGGGPEDNTFYFDRTNLFYPYHFGGLVSTLSSELIGQVDVHAGGFGAEFGNAQAIIDIQSREPDRKSFKLSTNVNFLMSELFMESPLGEDASFYLAGRRSYADLIIPRLITIEELTAFPRFWDYQLGLDYELSPRHQLHVNAFASDDFMELRIKEDDVTGQPDLAGKFHYRSGFVGQGITLRSLLGEKGILHSTLSHTKTLIDLSFGQGFFLRATPDLYSLREALSYEVAPRHTLQMGADLSTILFRTSAFFVRPPEEGDPDFDFSGEEKIRTESSDRMTYLEAYLQDQIKLSEWLSLTVGGRANHFNLTGETRIDPRSRISLLVPGGAQMTAAWGEYHQTPQPVEVSPDWGNPEVRATRSTHYVLEIEREVLSDTRLKVATYYKDFQDLITADRDAIYLNQGEGFARGLEILLKHRPSDDFFAWLSYSYSVSRRKDSPELEERLYTYDQTHVATLTMSYRPNPEWEFGMKWQYSTGTPFTPVVDAVLVQRPGQSPQYLPIYGETNSRRLPPFHRLDVRVTRNFSIAGKRLEAYLEVLNAYYRKNVLAIDYNDDYSEEERLYQLPIIPYIGVSMKF